MTVKIYFDPVSKGFYQTDIHRNIPLGSIEISDSERWQLIEGTSNGMEIVVVDGIVSLTNKKQSETDKSVSERLWRNSELERSDIELNKVQDSDPKAKGTVTQWREYRKALRSLPEHEKFPSVEARPVAPDA